MNIMKGKVSINTFNRIRLCFFLVGLLFFFLSSPVYGTAGDEVQKQQDEDLGKLEQTISQFLRERTDRLKKFTGFTIMGSAGLQGQNAGGSEMFQLDIGASVSKTLYPGEFSFMTGTRVLSQSMPGEPPLQMQLNVTVLNMSYEHYLTSWLETYGFIEKFANTFLLIRHRYEFGGGFKMEFSLLDNKARLAKEQYNYNSVMKKYLSYINSCNDLAKRDESSEIPIKTDSLLTQLENLKRKEKMNFDAFKKSQSRLTFSLAMSVFYELERPETIDMWFERARISLRPKLRFRPCDGITLEWYVYYKLPLGQGAEIKGDINSENSIDRYDYRTDALFRASLNLPQQISWARALSLVFEYQRHFDNAPPVPDLNLHNEFILKLEFVF